MEKNDLMLAGAVGVAAVAGAVYWLSQRKASTPAAPSPITVPNTPPPYTLPVPSQPAPSTPTPSNPPASIQPAPVLQPPGQPGGVVVKGVSTSAVEVSWAPVLGATRYAVIHPAWGVYPEETVAVTAGATTATVRNLAWNSPYSVWVQAGNDAGWGPRSELARGKTLA